jgi:hypothetical protein
LASELRFEEAEEVRRRAVALERTIGRAAEVRALLDAGEVVIAVDGRVVLLRDAQLAAACDRPTSFDENEIELLRSAAESVPVGRYVPGEIAREAGVISSWLRRNWERIELVSVAGAWAQAAGTNPGGRFHSSAR